jgi:hypothetical protein
MAVDESLRLALRELVGSGELKWIAGDGSQEEIKLSDKRARAMIVPLFDVTRAKIDAESGTLRERTSQEETMITRLENAWRTLANEKPDNPFEAAETEVSPKSSPTSWLLELVETNGFGGINGAAATQPFTLGLSSASTCFLGGNGSGKTSLISAISWGLTGQRISDVSGLSESSNSLAPVFDPENPENKIADWAPVATYPVDKWGYAKEANVSVKLTFKHATSDQRASIVRTWNSKTAPNTQVLWPPELESIKTCLDVAVEMPLRMAHLRFGEDGTLNEAVSALTGLDTLSAMGELVTALKRKDSKFLNTPKQSEHDQREADTTGALNLAAENLPSLSSELAPYLRLAGWIERPTEFRNGIEAIHERLISNAGNELQTLKEYVDSSINLEIAQGQQQVANAVAAALATYEPAHLKTLFPKICPTLTEFSKASESASEHATAMAALATRAVNDLDAIISIHRKKLLDSKFTLKAVAGETHRELHGGTPVLDCPLCERPLDSEQLQMLGAEIQVLANEAELIRQSLLIACRELATTVNKAVNSALGRNASTLVEFDPVDEIANELRELLIKMHSFSQFLPIFGSEYDRELGLALVRGIPKCEPASSYADISIAELSAEDREIIAAVQIAIAGTLRAEKILLWIPVGISGFRKFYTTVLGKAATQDESATGFRALASELDRALGQARPSQAAAALLQRATTTAAIWLKDAETKQVRSEIIRTIEPLRFLPKFVSAEIGRQLGAMSDRIADIVDRFHVTAAFGFAGTRLEREARRRKAFLRARAAPRSSNDDGKRSSDSSYEIDALQIANTSWMRALLWAFIFALREERADKLGGLPLPLILMDDPQATFDVEHRCAWTDFVLGKEAAKCMRISGQVLLATHDRSFTHHISLYLPHFPIRHLSSPSSDTDSIFVSGSSLIDEFWAEAKLKRTNAASSAAIGQLRIHIETMMKSIFPPAMGGTEPSLGKLMSQFAGKYNQSVFPYENPEFGKLIDAWKDPTKEKFRVALSEPHHSSDSAYDFNFAKDLFGWWNGVLTKVFQVAFETVLRIRENGWRMPHLSVAMPAKLGQFDTALTKIPMPANLNNVIGRVAAETEGREIVFLEGQPALHFIEQSMVGSAFGSFEAVVVAAATLEPTAQIGDVLLLSPSLPPTPNCLVVCEAEGGFRARRYSTLTSSSSNVALLASAINPREIRQTILVEPTASKFKKVVGIVFSHGWEVPPSSENEVVNVGFSVKLEQLLGDAVGLVSVVGNSAEPIALNGQFLILGPTLSSKNELASHSGKPVVVLKDGRPLFKRLRFTFGDGPLVLESLDAGGRHPPVVIPHEELSRANDNLSFRPVLGVLFDPPAPS